MLTVVYMSTVFFLKQTHYWFRLQQMQIDRFYSRCRVPCFSESLLSVLDEHANDARPQITQRDVVSHVNLTTSILIVRGASEAGVQRFFLHFTDDSTIESSVKC